jgi:antitoxin component of MazEF toxin-antitoxin module
MSGQSLDYRVEDHKAIIFSPQLPLAQGKVAITQRGGGASLGIIIPADACRKIGIGEDTFLSIKLSGKGYFGLERAAVDQALEGLLKRSLRKRPISVKTQV